MTSSISRRDHQISSSWSGVPSINIRPVRKHKSPAARPPLRVLRLLRTHNVVGPIYPLFRGITGAALRTAGGSERFAGLSSGGTQTFRGRRIPALALNRDVGIPRPAKGFMFD